MSTGIDKIVQVVISEGLAGASVELSVHSDSDMHSVSAELGRLIYADTSMCFRLTAEAEIITSVPQLLNIHRLGSQIFAFAQKHVANMSMTEVAEELAIGEEEFKGHRFALSKLSSGSTPRDAAMYLRSNRLLLTAEQASNLFDMLLLKLRPIEGVQYGLRGQLVLALHTFCLEPCAIWEPDDGNSECVWANMSWNKSFLSEQNRYKTRGTPRNHRLENSASSSTEQKDIMNLRAVLAARRTGTGDELNEMRIVKAYNTPILPE